MYIKFLWISGTIIMNYLFQGSDSDVSLEHNHDNDEAVLFSFKQKTIFTKKKVGIF